MMVMGTWHWGEDQDCSSGWQRGESCVKGRQRKRRVKRCLVVTSQLGTTCLRLLRTNSVSDILDHTTHMSNPGETSYTNHGALT